MKLEIKDYSTIFIFSSFQCFDNGEISEVDQMSSFLTTNNDAIQMKSNIENWGFKFRGTEKCFCFLVIQMDLKEMLMMKEIDFNQ